MFSGVQLSRNRGHQNALLAGLTEAAKHADVIVSMDADLQDDINAVDAMLEKYRGGCEVVYGVRSERKTDTAFKRMTAEGFYRFMQAMGVDIVYNHADYRLMSRRAVEALEQFSEVNLFLRGIVPLVGFKSDTVTYARGERFAGESKYPLKKMIAFAMDGITSFSVKPIRLILSVGALVFLVSIAMLLYSLIRKLLGHTVRGLGLSGVLHLGAGRYPVAESGRDRRIRRKNLQRNEAAAEVHYCRCAGRGGGYGGRTGVSVRVAFAWTSLRRW